VAGRCNWPIRSRSTRVTGQWRPFMTA
jgi:hypothetical protein